MARRKQDDMAIIIIRLIHSEPSTCTDHVGAVDYDIEALVGDADAEEWSATLIPGDADGDLGTWGQIDHWLSGGGCAVVRALVDLDEGARERLVAALVSTCRDGDERQVEVDAASWGESDGDADAAEVIRESDGDLGKLRRQERAGAVSWGNSASEAAWSEHVPRGLHSEYVAAYCREAHATIEAAIEEAEEEAAIEAAAEEAEEADADAAVAS